MRRRTIATLRNMCVKMHSASAPMTKEEQRMQAYEYYWNLGLQEKKNELFQQS